VWDGVYMHIPGYAQDLAGDLSKEGLFTRDAKRAAVETFFAMLREGKLRELGPYVSAIEELAKSWRLAEKGPISVKDLPDHVPSGAEPE
jgi:hypothetical protein